MRLRSEPARAAAIIVAAGRGTRLGSPEKILLSLADRPLLAYSVDAAEAAGAITDIVIVAGMHTKPAIERLVDRAGWSKVRHVALGGERRQDSVEAGLRLVQPDVSIVAVHDAARPMVTAELFDACVAAARTSGAAIAAIPVSDTLKRVRGETIDTTVPRDDMWCAQTPQAFDAALLRRSFDHAAERNLTVTDEAGLMEALGVMVTVVRSSPLNLKVTHPDDLDVIEAMIVARRSRHRR